MTPGHGDNLIHRPAARLALEDGTVFRGRAFGATADAAGRPLTIAGEVVFNTAMTGYQEALTDPSYAGQILAMTAPLIGNYGVNEEDMESKTVQAAAFVVRELSRVRSNHRATVDLSTWLARAGVPGIEGIDTRALTRRLRIEGAMRGILSTDDSLTDALLVERARSSPSMAGANLVTKVSARQPYAWEENLGVWARMTDDVRLADPRRRRRIVALDCGAKQNILRHLTERGCEVMVLPHSACADDIRRLKPDGLFVSNGPGDPAAVNATIATLREIAGEVPTFGICLGHQLLCLALGATTYKLKFGHRGANQPVKNLLTGHVEITSQNHGFAVETASMTGADCEPTHVNLNDGTLAGFRHLSKPIFAVQYHPEASPGPHDAAYLFDCFLLMIESGRPISAEQMRRAWEAAQPGAAAPRPAHV